MQSGRDKYLELPHSTHFQYFTFSIALICRDIPSRLTTKSLNTGKVAKELNLSPSLTRERQAMRGLSLISIVQTPQLRALHPYLNAKSGIDVSCACI